VVVIRLTRIGKKKQAFYRVVAADSKRPVQAKFIKILGWYNPHSKELSIKKDEVNDWLAKGAQPSNTVAKLLKAEGIKLPDWVEIKEKKRKPKNEKPAGEKKEAVKEEKAEETAAEEAPQEETPAEAPEESEPAAEEPAASE
jgi:small subunit ribosomal protein S16